MPINSTPIWHGNVLSTVNASFCSMDEIMSVAVYKDIGALTGETDKVEKMYDPEHVRTPPPDDGYNPVILTCSLRFCLMRLMRELL